MTNQVPKLNLKQISEHEIKLHNTFKSDKPTIGITFDWRETVEDDLVKFSYYEMKHQEYTSAVRKRGANPYVISFNDDLDEIVPKLDGLLIAGGRDIHPSFYGEPVNGSVIPPNNRRFEFEKCLYEKLSKRIPILGVCWGMQFLNVVNGGSLHQDIPTKHDHLFKVVENTIVPGTWLNQVYGEKVFAYCMHHQALNKVAKGFTVSSYDSEGYIHSFENINEEIFQLGVQYHPEVIYKEEGGEKINKQAKELFSIFVRKANDYKILKQSLGVGKE